MYARGGITQNSKMWRRIKDIRQKIFKDIWFDDSANHEFSCIFMIFRNNAFYGIRVAIGSKKCLCAQNEII